MVITGSRITETWRQQNAKFEVYHFSLTATFQGLGRGNNDTGI